MDTTILQKTGLTDSQAKGYLALIEHGVLTPTMLAEITEETRTNAYMICEKLADLGLAQKTGDRKTTYRPLSPVNIKKMLVAEQRRIKQASDELAGTLPSLITQFSLNSDSPGVITLEGKPGIKTLYGDILHEGYSLRIIPSEHDRTDPEINKTIDQQIQKQIEKGIESQVLYKNISQAEARSLRNHGIHVRTSNIHTPAQVIIYGDNVAISTFRDGMITSVISHPDIAETFRQLFDNTWHSALNPLANQSNE